MKLTRLLSAAALGVATVLATPAVALAKVNVVATLPDLASLAREVGGDDVAVTALAVPTQDPHFVDARPSLVLPLNRADLLMLVGMQLEIGWLPNLITGSRNAKIQPNSAGTSTASGYFDASSFVPLKQVPTTTVDRSMGDIHPQGNPHYMADPRNAARVALALADRLGEIDAAHTAGYHARAKAFAAACAAFAAKEIARFGALPAERRKAVVYHQSMIYLLDWLGVQQSNTLEPKPGIPPSPDHVAKVLVQMRTQKIPALLQEDYRPRNPGDLVADKAGAKQVIVPGGPNFDGGETYLANVRTVVDRLYAGLKP